MLDYLARRAPALEALLGLGLLVGGVAAYSWAWAMIVAGALLLADALLSIGARGRPARGTAVAEPGVKVVDRPRPMTDEWRRPA